MNTRRYGGGKALLALLGLGAVDLAVLNQWALPAVLTVTDVRAATDLPPRRPPLQQPAVAPGRAPTALPAVEAAHDTETSAYARSAAAAMHEEPAHGDDTGPPQAVVRFSKGAWWIGRSGRETLSSTLTQLEAADRWVEVSGHADREGPENINQRISEARASAVVALLVRSGVDEGRIRVRAFGEHRPSSTGRDRRVEITIRGNP
jgi:outer membrane protein OmpA-like peptidoglycan-associated protein